jgi:carbonic anhydrase
VPDTDFLARIRRFETATFPHYERVYRQLVADGQHPSTLFIGCSDSRIVPYLLMDCGPGELFIVRNVGALVPPEEGATGHHGTAAAIEFALLSLGVTNIVVCGHSHCGAMRALYREPHPEALHMNRWLDFARPAALPVQECEEVLRRVEQRSVVLQLEHLLSYALVRDRVAKGELFLHGWHYLMEEGRILVFDFESGSFRPHERAGEAVRQARGIDSAHWGGVDGSDRPDRWAPFDTARLDPTGTVPAR